MSKIIIMAGSIRSGSLNVKLAKYANRLLKEKVSLKFVDLNDYPLPIYNGDLEGESGIPNNAKKLKELFIEHDGFIFTCPEYNSSVTPLWKNTIDWISRPEKSDPYPLPAFKGKRALLLAASPGSFGGLRGLNHVRDILENIGTIVYPDRYAIPGADKIFDENGNINDEKIASTIERLFNSFIQFL